MELDNVSPDRKAHEVNLNGSIYGTFAEIGAGQEVARHFFLAGRASGTIAKTMSAYDMIFSDAIYGKEESGRYVCERRLMKMLSKEFDLLIERLDSVRGDRTTFFAFADTVATGSHHHGWLGVRFQTAPRGPANDIILHVNLLDRSRLQQQEALGVLGVNLIHNAFYVWKKPEMFLPALMEHIGRERIEIDMLKFSGPDLKHINNHLMALELLKAGVTNAVLFDGQGVMQQPSDVLYHKPVVVQKGSFRPVANINLEMQESALGRCRADWGNVSPVSLMEINIHDMKTSNFDFQDLLHRVETFTALGQNTIISDYPLFHDLKTFLRRHTREPIALVGGAPILDWLFDESQYKNLPGGLVEALGRLFDDKTTFYAYPFSGGAGKATADAFKPEGARLRLFEYFREMGRIVDLPPGQNSAILAKDVRRMLKDGSSEWKKHVPAKVAALIEEKGLFR